MTRDIYIYIHDTDTFISIYAIKNKFKSDKVILNATDGGSGYTGGNLFFTTIYPVLKIQSKKLRKLLLEYLYI